MSDDLTTGMKRVQLGSMTDDERRLYVEEKARGNARHILLLQKELNEHQVADREWKKDAEARLRELEHQSIRDHAMKEAAEKTNSKVDVSGMKDAAKVWGPIVMALLALVGTLVSYLLNGGAV